MSTAGVDKDYMGSKMTEHVSILWKLFFATDAANKQATVFAPVQAFWAYCNICAQQGQGLTSKYKTKKNIGFKQTSTVFSTLCQRQRKKFYGIKT